MSIWESGIWNIDRLRFRFYRLKKYHDVKLPDMENFINIWFLFRDISPNKHSDKDIARAADRLPIPK